MECCVWMSFNPFQCERKIKAPRTFWLWADRANGRAGQLKNHCSWVNTCLYTWFIFCWKTWVAHWQSLTSECSAECLCWLQQRQQWKLQLHLQLRTSVFFFYVGPLGPHTADPNQQYQNLKAACGRMIFIFSLRLLWGVYIYGHWHYTICPLGTDRAGSCSSIVFLDFLLFFPFILSLSLSLCYRYKPQQHLDSHWDRTERLLVNRLTVGQKKKNNRAKRAGIMIMIIQSLDLSFFKGSAEHSVQWNEWQTVLCFKTFQHATAGLI